MLPVEIPNEFRIQYVRRGHPRPLLRTISFPVDEVLSSMAPISDCQELLNSEKRFPIKNKEEEGVGVAVTKGLSLTGLIRLAWKVGCTLIVLGSFSLAATALIILEKENGPINLEVSLQLSGLNGKSLAESQTFCPIRYIAPLVRRRSACFLYNSEECRRF